MKKIISLLVIVSFSVVFITWCTDKNSVKVWDTISITYTATFTDGKIFEQNTAQTPLTFTIGSWQVIKWLDEGLIGVGLGKSKTIKITPDIGYGNLYTKNNVQKISQLIFDKLSIQPKSWTIQILGDIEWVIKWTETDTDGNILVLFDINPRQTRDTLIYKVTVLEKK